MRSFLNSFSSAVSGGLCSMSPRQAVLNKLFARLLSAFCRRMRRRCRRILPRDRFPTRHLSRIGLQRDEIQPRGLGALGQVVALERPRLLSSSLSKKFSSHVSQAPRVRTLS